MKSNILKLSSKPLAIFLFIINLTALILCDGKPTRQDLKNAMSIGQTIKKNKSSTSENIKYSPQANDTEVSHTVQKHVLKPGETLQDLAAIYNTDIQTIRKANGIEDLNELKPGQVILIPIKKNGHQ